MGRETALVNSVPTLLCRFTLLRGLRLDHVEKGASLPLAVRSCFDGFFWSLVCCDSNAAGAEEGTVDMASVGRIGSQSVKKGVSSA